MTDPRFPNFKYPEGRSPLLVRVFNLSPSSEEQVVKDFFRFCGKIDDFAMIKTESGDSLEALICFEKEGAAKTALMLTNATIGDRMIKVEPYYKESEEETSQKSADNTAETSRGNQDDTQSKPEAASSTSSYLSSLWSTGYQLSQTVFHGAKTLDSTYGISTQAAAYLEKAKEETKKLDEKYHVSERAVDLDSKLGIRDKLTQAVSTASVLGKQALETEQGKKVHGLYEKAVSTAAELKDEALRAINLDTSASSSSSQVPANSTASDSTNPPPSSSANPPASGSTNPPTSSSANPSEEATTSTKAPEKSPQPEPVKETGTN